LERFHLFLEQVLTSLERLHLFLERVLTSLERLHLFLERILTSLERFTLFKSGFPLHWSGSLTSWRGPSLFRCNLTLLLEQTPALQNKKNQHLLVFPDYC